MIENGRYLPKIMRRTHNFEQLTGTYVPRHVLEISVGLSQNLPAQYLFVLVGAILVYLQKEIIIKLL